MMAFLPIVVVIGVIIGVIFVSRAMLARMSIWAPKRIWIFAGSYIALGFIAFISLPFIAGNEQRILAEQEIATVKQQVDLASTQAANNEWDKIDEAYKKAEYVFEAEESTIDVQADMASANVYVYVTWNEEKTNNITATYYELPTITSGIDITNELLPTQVQFEQDVLTIKEPQVELTYYTLRPTLTVVENFVDTFNYDGSLHNYFIGHRILHLNVPKHITIMDNSGWLQYLYN